MHRRLVALIVLWALLLASLGFNSPAGASAVAAQRSNVVAREAEPTAAQEPPERISILVQHDGVDLFAQKADTPLAVASAFKLVVIASLRRQITAGARAWDDIVTLQPSWKTLPSGILQTWPDGAPLTLDTLAALMISQSDNTATNALIDIVGREEIEALSPRNRPLMNVTEFVALKDPANADLLADYRSGDEATRRRVLVLAGERPAPDPTLFAGEPLALDVEYFLTARELCELIEEVADLPMMGINPGAASPSAWSRIAFKGGSEQGVFNLTHHLLDEQGGSWCVVGTRNDDVAFDPAPGVQQIRDLIATLR